MTSERNATALVVGGASGLGAATVSALGGDGYRVVVADLNADAAATVAAGAGSGGEGVRTDITNDDDLRASIGVAEQLSPLRVGVICAGIGHAERLVSREGMHQRETFERVIAVNLVGTFNALRFIAAAMAANQPDERGERGVVVLTASVASFDGQVGQAAYAAAKAAVAGLVLPAARDLASHAIRVCAIAPGAFETPLLAGLPAPARDALAEHVPFPRRLGQPSEFASLALEIVRNPMMNGEVVRLDGGLRMPYVAPRGAKPVPG